ncbi:MAG: dienelactone hydrolase family protein [Chloroflexi bacterium]|nr:dienelactone hydrolase family protein [Chloroflexota bacterium]
MRLVLAPGASGSATSLRPHVEGLRARGIEATAIDVPKGKAERAVSAYRERAGEGPGLVIGGHSYGGRVASLLAAEPDIELAGLVLLSYPLHRPGGPEWEPRTRHWEAIRCPVLILSGESDPFSRIDLMRQALTERLPSARLVTYPRVGHGLTAVLDDALDQVAAFMEALG